MARTLRSKRLRAALYIAADGKCQICGCELPDDWHADHIVPYSKTGRTNVHEMQALCPTCNQKKGSVMPLRRHQKELQELGRQIANNIEQSDDGVIADVTPGGGKSKGICLFAKELINGNKVNHVIWGCPRNALVSQAADDWASEGLDNRMLSVVHYQQLSSELLMLQHRCKHVPTLFVADELQFLHDFGDNNGTWDANGIALKNAASFYLGVSGTLFSSRPGPLLGVTYRSAEHMRKEHPDEEFRSGMEYADPHVSYNLRQALAENAVIPYEIDQQLIDFKASSSEEVIGLYTPESNNYKSLLRDVLCDRNSWIPIVEKCCTQWLEYRKTHYKSNAIFIAASQSHARDICEYLHSKRVITSLAISEHPNAIDSIEQLKRRKFDNRPRALVTVAMASVGLSIPEVSHLCYLSHYRFWGFMLQAWARASRVCYDSGLSWGQQLAYVYTVRDPRMDQFVAWIKQQQRKGIGSGGIGGDGPPPGEEHELEYCETVGSEYETSDVGDGVSGSMAVVVERLVSAAPILHTLPKKVLAEIAPAIDTSKLNRPHEMPVRESVDNIAGSDALKKRAVKTAVNAICNKIAYKVNRSPDEVRCDMQRYGGQFRSVENYSYPDQMIALLKRYADELRQLDSEDSTIVLKSVVRSEWDSVKRVAMFDQKRDQADLITEIFHEFGIPLQCIAKESSRE